jgi:DNA segregation ATPase FtsK/SpoIIIE-like protein
MNENLVKLGDDSFIMWNLQQAAHILVVGASGSGKTYFCKTLLGRISLYDEEAKIYACDYKGDDDFSFLNGCQRFYRFDECGEGLNAVFDILKARQNGDKERNRIVMYFDEFASYINNISDKKQLEEEKKKLASLLMLGRSFCISIIVSLQRADASFFSSGARDNFHINVALGNISTEAKEMLFAMKKDEIKADRQRGTGYMTINGVNLTKIIVPEVTNTEKLHDAIVEGVTR